MLTNTFDLVETWVVEMAGEYQRVGDAMSGLYASSISPPPCSAWSTSLGQPIQPLYGGFQLGCCNVEVFSMSLD